jgi:hypothetical protein
MFLPLVPAQEFAKEYFRRALATGRLSHAYLFLGPEGAGKRLFAHELSKAFFCSRGVACGECPPCRTISHGNHPLVDFCGPAEGKSLIDIETIRALCAKTHYRTDRIHVAVVERSELLSEPAANALLKTLEEPPASSILILTAQSAGTLLPTIVSRCHRIFFTGGRTSGPALSREDCERLSACLGSEFFANFEPREWLASFAGAEGGTLRQQVRKLLETVVEAERERWRKAVGIEVSGAGRATPGFPPEAGLDRSLRRSELLLDLRADLDRNVQPDLVLERAIRELQEPQAR